MKKLACALLLSAVSFAVYSENEGALDVATMDKASAPQFTEEQQEMIIVQKVFFDAQIDFLKDSDNLEVMDSVVKSLDTQPEAALNKLFSTILNYVDANLPSILSNVAEEFGLDEAEFVAKYKSFVEQNLGAKIQEFVIVYAKSGLDKRAVKGRNPIRIKQ